ncbi:MAG: rhomboid family intramembrane serine protease [Bdellovibrionaceae bacterium]|nr:rhomboid family intramembrane serine protease [Pseudobdellovibrionaceae bacterium]
MHKVPPKKSTSVGYIYLQGKPNQLIPLKAKFKFGRSEIYNHSSVSRNHFMISVNDGGTYFILDQGSRTGTRVDGQQVSQSDWMELREGSQITCGPYVFVFTIKQQSLASPSKNTSKSAAPAKERPLELQKTIVVSRPRRFTPRPSIIQHHKDHKNDNTFLALMASANIIIFACLMMLQGSLAPMSTTLLVKYGGNIPYLTTSGQWWRLLTSPFLHLDIWHLVGNVSALYFAMVFIIQYLTPNKIIVVYLGSAFVASLMSTLMNPVTTVSIGASGAIFGLYGALLVSIIMYRNQGIKLNIWLVLTIIYFVYDNMGWGQKDIGYWAHAGGFGAGAVITYMCLEALPENDRSSSFKLYGVFASVVLCAVMVLPVRKLNQQQQMGHFFSLYMNTVGEYYDNLHAYEKHRNVGKLEKSSAQILKKLDDIEVFMNKEKPVNQKADYYRKQISYLIKKTKSHLFAVTKFIKTGNQKFALLAKREDNDLASYMAMMSKEFGFVKEKSSYEKQLEISSERQPAARQK